MNLASPQFLLSAIPLFSRHPLLQKVIFFSIECIYIKGRLFPRYRHRKRQLSYIYEAGTRLHAVMSDLAHSRPQWSPSSSGDERM